MNFFHICISTKQIHWVFSFVFVCLLFVRQTLCTCALVHLCTITIFWLNRVLLFIRSLFIVHTVSDKLIEYV